MERAAQLSRAADKIVSVIAMISVLLMLLYGSYSLLDDYLVSQGGFGSELMKYKPDSGNTYSLAELMRINPDVIGWISIENTNIDQPVTQGKDDMEYVNLNALKEHSLSGSVFLSCVNSRDFSDIYNLTYGHHMDNGGMYGDVTKYLENDFFLKHRKGSLVSLDQEWEIELFSVIKTDASNDLFYNASYQDKQSQKERLKYLKKQSKYYKDIGINDTDSIIALSTCYDVDTNGRVIVCGRLTQTK